MAEINALIPLSGKHVDLGNSLAQGVEVGNALLDAPVKRRLLEAQAQYYNSPDSRAKVYGTIYPHKDPETGEVSLWALGKDGKMYPAEGVGEGLEYLPPVKPTDYGDRIQNTGPGGLTYGGGMKAGNPEAGTRPSETAPGGYEPYGPGAIRDQETHQRKLSESQALKETAADIVTTEIGRAKTLIAGQGAVPATGGGSVLSGLPGTDAHNLSNILDTVKANIGFDKLQATRQSSPTGAALGPVSDFENRLLQATLGSVQQSQTQEQLLFNLDRLNTIYNKIVHEGIKDPNAAPAAAPVTTDTPGGVYEAPEPKAFPPGMTEQQVKAWVQEAMQGGYNQQQIVEALKQLGVQF